MNGLWLRFLLLAALFFPMSACANLGGLQVDVRSLAAQPPANVAVYVDVDAGQDAVELEAQNFTLYEDGQALSSELTQQVLLEPAHSVAHHTLLLVDNSLATDEDVRSELGNAIAIFVEVTSRTQPVSVFAYDGAERLTFVADFPRVAQPKPISPAALKRLSPKDVSRNLNGAIVLAGKELDERLGAAAKSFKVGTLVVFAAGPDLAGRADEDSVYRFLETTRHSVLTIGYGDQSAAVEAFAKDGYFDAVAKTTISLAFEEAAHHVSRRFGRGYLLSYCSPARSGVRSLSIEVTHRNDGVEQTGTASTEFSAQGFRAGCDPMQVPRFEAPPAGEQRP